MHKKLGNVPDGGGWRYVDRAQRQKNRTATYVAQRKTKRPAKVGTAYIHTVLDDHSRVGYVEIHDDEKAVTAAGVLRRAAFLFCSPTRTVRQNHSSRTRTRCEPVKARGSVKRRGRHHVGHDLRRVP